MERWPVLPKDGAAYFLDMADGTRITATWAWVENHGWAFLDAQGAIVPKGDIEVWNDPPSSHGLPAEE